MTTQIVSQTTPLVQTMNSLQIAELVNARHDSVKRTIERLADQEAIRLPPMVNVEKINNLGLPIQVKTYLFEGEQGKLDSITVVAQLCPLFTAQIVKRWQELETQVAQGALTTDPLHQINTNIQKMADGMAVLASGMQVLAQASHTQMRTLDRTEAYIGLLEMNQKGTVKVTPELADEVKRLKALGYSQADIARHLRLGKTTVSLIVNDKYQFSQLFTNEPTADRQLATTQVLQELLPNFAQGDN